jgi:hypothetical protein
MSSRRTVALGVAVWLIVVAAGAGLVWAVISRAGEGVASSAQPNVDSSVDSSIGSSPTASPPTAKGNGSGEAPRDPPSGRKTWQGDPGYVTAQCEGGAIGANAQPNDGWRIEVDDNGPRQVEVEFESADERSRVKVEAVCVDGVPVFEVDNRAKG